PTDGLNQKFRIMKDSANRKRIKISTTLTDEDLSKRILIEVPVDDYVHLIRRSTYEVAGSELSFSNRIVYLATLYEQDKKISPEISLKCKGCEFRCTPEQEAEGYKSGFKECWKEMLNWKDSDFEEPSVLELWSSQRKNSYISAG